MEAEAPREGGGARPAAGPSPGPLEAPAAPVRPLPSLQGEKRGEAQGKEEGSVCGDQSRRRSSAGRRGCGAQPGKGRGTEGHPGRAGSQGLQCQAINNRLKGNNRIQWRTINKTPLV